MLRSSRARSLPGRSRGSKPRAPGSRKLPAASRGPRRRGIRCIRRARQALLDPVIAPSHVVGNDLPAATDTLEEEPPRAVEPRVRRSGDPPAERPESRVHEDHDRLALPFEQDRRADQGSTRHDRVVRLAGRRTRGKDPDVFPGPGPRGPREVPPEALVGSVMPVGGIQEGTSVEPCDRRDRPLRRELGCPVETEKGIGPDGLPRSDRGCGKSAGPGDRERERRCSFRTGSG